jgi:protoheme IX farnesyltransferase
MIQVPQYSRKPGKMPRNENYQLMRKMRFLSLASTISIFLLTVLIGILRDRGLVGICPVWSACVNPWSLREYINFPAAFIYQFLTLIVILFLIAGVISAYLRFKFKQTAWPYYFSLILFLIQLFVIRNVIISGDNGFSSWIHSVDLGISLIILSLMAYAATLTFLNVNVNNHLAFQTLYSKLSLSILAILFIVFISGVIVTISGAFSYCRSWPLCGDFRIPYTFFDWINVFHRIFVMIVGVLLLIQMSKAWREHRSNPVILITSTTAFVLYFSQALLAAQMVDSHEPYQSVLHQATAVAVWVTVIIHVTYVGMSKFNNIANQLIIDHKAKYLINKFKDLILLTKPIVVTLLLITTYAGMVIGGKELPTIPLTLWTLLGGFMAAGGSGAINQYIDRFDDLKMQRTQKRPIPSGRLTPAEGLAFGIAMTIASFYIMVAFVNLPAALLTLAGIVYYIFIYSIFLKKNTVQNIVIGGGAGAIPPLVGWASATGGLNVPSLFLFAVVFMWTPPHFWALAIVRRKDYARAGVPMMPVVRGEKETRWQILIYTIELFVLTLLLPIFGLGGSIYLIGALLLGLWLLSAAWRVWKLGGNKHAWRMYRYSSMYLAFLFMVLMIDALI